MYRPEVIKWFFCFGGFLYFNKIPNYMKHLKFLLFPLLLISCYLSFLAVPAIAQDLGHDPATFRDLEEYIRRILNRVTSLGLIAVFVMFLWGGFKYLTAGGNPETNQAAQKILTYAVLGLVLLIGAWFILRFIAVFTGLDNRLLDFSIVLN